MTPATISPVNLEIGSIEDWMMHPPRGKEWVNRVLVVKHPAIAINSKSVEGNGMTLKHSCTQARLAAAWQEFKHQAQLHGEVYAEAPCRTNKQGRRKKCYQGLG